MLRWLTTAGAGTIIWRVDAFPEAVLRTCPGYGPGAAVVNYRWRGHDNLAC
ncbi:hypothetical protein [Raoultella sp. T31]|uniref:hypothetical protein n=1 Tax=Raoultella sp. T31 TaxID=2054594 RepID=UPI0013FD701C